MEGNGVSRRELLIWTLLAGATGMYGRGLIEKIRGKPVFQPIQYMGVEQHIFTGPVKPEEIKFSDLLNRESVDELRKQILEEGGYIQLNLSNFSSTDLTRLNIYKGREPLVSLTGSETNLNPKDRLVIPSGYDWPIGDNGGTFDFVFAGFQHGAYMGKFEKKVDFLSIEEIVKRLYLKSEMDDSIIEDSNFLLHSDGNKGVHYYIHGTLPGLYRQVSGDDESAKYSIIDIFNEVRSQRGIGSKSNIHF